MNKPKIEIKEVGAMGPDGYDIFVNGDSKYRTRYREDAEGIRGMIDALIKADSLLGLNLPETNSERQIIRNALKKAGVQL